LDPEPYPYLLLALLGFFVSSFFSIIKIVFSSLSRANIPADMERLRYYSARIEELEENKNSFVATVSVGKSIANAVFSLSGYLFITLQWPEKSFGWHIAILFITVYVFLVIFAYFLARAVAYRFFIPLAYVCYPVFSMINWPLTPFVFMGQTVHTWFLKLLKHDERYAFLSRAEKERMGGTDEDEDSLDEEERDMIHSIFSFGETDVEEIMLPRVDLIALEASTSLELTLKTISEEGHSRIPVYRDTIDTIIGLVYAKDVLRWLSRNNDHSSFNLEKLIKRAHFVPASKKIDDLLREFKKKHIHMAIIVDEYGGTAGIVTMEDILEEIVGEIHDEYDDEEKAVIQISKTLFHVDPQVSLEDLEDEIGVALENEDEDYNTLGGLIYHECGEVPQVNTEIETHGLRIKVLTMDNQRIQKVAVTIDSGSKNNEEQ